MYAYVIMSVVAIMRLGRMLVLVIYFVQSTSELSGA